MTTLGLPPMQQTIVAESDWWRRALRGERPSIYPDHPEAGYFRTRLVRGGPWVPARIWLEEWRCPETRHLLADVIYRCEVAGQRRDPFQQWTWLCEQPIPLAEYHHLVRVADWADRHAPDQPEATPGVPIDLKAIPTIF